MIGMINVDITHQIVSIVFVCHADSGKSTVLCSLLYNLGQVDERAIEKYKREAKVNNPHQFFIYFFIICRIQILIKIICSSI